MKKKLFVFTVGVVSFFSCTKDKNYAVIPNLPKEGKHTNKHEIKNNTNHGTSPQTQNLQTQTPASATLNIDSTTNIFLNRVTATVNSSNISQLSFHESGYIKSVNVKNGQFVTKGSEIAELENDILTQQLILAKNTLEQATVNLALSKMTLNRTIELNKKQATTQSAVEKADSDYSSVKISVKTAQANLEIAKINMRDSKLYAPFDGYVLNLNTWIGNYVSLSTSIVTLVSLNDLQIQIPVPQTIPNNFKIGQEFNFLSTSNENSGVLTLSGIVPFVDPNTKTYFLYANPKQVKIPLMSGELIFVQLN